MKAKATERRNDSLARHVVCIKLRAEITALERKLKSVRSRHGRSARIVAALKSKRDRLINMELGGNPWPTIH